MDHRSGVRFLVMTVFRPYPPCGYQSPCVSRSEPTCLVNEPLKYGINFIGRRTSSVLWAAFSYPKGMPLGMAFVVGSVGRHSVTIARDGEGMAIDSCALPHWQLPAKEPGIRWLISL
jgi:hypothetical protein